MTKRIRIIALTATLGTLALGFALAKNGADDPAGHRRGGGDDPAGHARIVTNSDQMLLAKRGADDPAGHGGNDDPMNHG